MAEYPWREAGNMWRSDPDAKPRIVRLNTYTGCKRTLNTAPLSGAWLLADRNDEVRFALGRDTQMKLAVSWIPQTDEDWAEFRMPGFREETVQPRKFSSDNRSVLFTGVREGESFSGLYQLDLQTRAVESLHVFENADIADLITDFAGREIVGVCGHADRPVYHWLVKDNPAVKLYRGLQQHVQADDTQY